MSLDDDKRASPKKTRKKVAIKHEKRKRSQVEASTLEGSQQGVEGGKAPKLSIAKEVKGTSKIRLKVVRKFYTSDLNQAEYYVIMDGKSIYFNVEAINKLYDLPFDAETPEQALITTTLKRQAREALKTIVWLGVECDITLTGNYLLYPHRLTTKASM
ncbi:hypothetical protein E5676_scaffold216G00140 [Cucumis melo var. makuwa]|uniref:Gag/pol protein n=2 Tax=Cucumis melo TaxID=3656 RepID=A0A5A7URT6_CUCMM|nr:hypothetical protein E6C27_scaffold280G002180 [Cucumis melo var. makuwa]TYK30046.1 hypothetical protein E5676_scaffold216G00140 [Cucumis melo var. makuwa]